MYSFFFLVLYFFKHLHSYFFYLKFCRYVCGCQFLSGFSADANIRDFFQSTATDNFFAVRKYLKAGLIGGMVSLILAQRKESVGIAFVITGSFVKTLSTCSSIFIYIGKQQLWLAEINHMIYFSQSQLLLAKKK